MANYKKITDVDVLAEASETTNVLVEENGSLKKVPASAVGGGYWNMQTTETVVYDQKGISFSESDGGWQYKAYPTSGSVYFTIEADKTYTINFSGIVHTLRVVSVGSYLYIGNISLFDNSAENTGESFAMRRDGTEFCMYTTLSGGVYDVSIAEVNYNIVFSGNAIKNVIHTIYDEDSDTSVHYLGEIADGNNYIATVENVKDMIDHYGFVLQKFYINGEHVGSYMVTGYDLDDGTIIIYWP